MKSRVVGCHHTNGRMLVCDTVMAHRCGGPCWRGARATGARIIQAQRLSANRHRVGCKSAVEELMLLVLDDEQAASSSVIEEPTIVLHQRRIRFVRAGPDNDSIVSCQTPPLER